MIRCLHMWARARTACHVQVWSQVRTQDLVAATALEQDFTYEAQWQVASAAPATASGRSVASSRALRLQLTAADGTQSSLGVTAGPRASTALAHPRDSIPSSLHIFGPSSRSKDRTIAAARMSHLDTDNPALAAPLLAASMVQALRQLTGGASGQHTGATLPLETVSLLTHSEASAAAQPHG